MSLPEWFQLDAAAVAKRSRLEPHQVEGDYDENSKRSDVEQLIGVFAPTVISRLRRGARPLSFPCTLAQLQVAFPGEDVASLNDQIAEQKSNAAAAVEQIVIAMLYKTIGTEEYQAVSRQLLDGRGIGGTGQARLSSAESIIVGVEASLKDAVWLHYMNSEITAANIAAAGA